MSDTYEIGGVTIKPLGGGFYELTHPSLAEPEKLRGKEKADERAAEIAASSLGADGSMEPQPPIDQVVPAAAVGSEITELQALVARQSAMIERLLAAAATTVAVTEESSTETPLAVLPREYSGQVDAKTRKAAAALGVEYVTIILEEGNDIPPTGLFLGHNGRSYMISPGEPVDVPDFLLGILDDAIMSTPVVDSKTQKVLGYRNRMKYPYRRV